jgi:ribosomal protein S18 acetylase RimI-like enzyme
MIEGVTRHDFQNHKSAIIELLQEIEFVGEDKAKLIVERIEANFADYRDFSLFHFSDNHLSGAIFSRAMSDFTEIGRTLKVSYMAVRPQFQGKGIARDLFDYFLSTAKHSYANITLSCYEKNERAIKFYTKYGFWPYKVNGQLQTLIKDSNTANEHRDIVFIRRFPLRDVTIRPLRTSNVDFLKEMVFLSLFKESGLFDREILETKEISKYYRNWDSKKEIGFIARYNDKDIGAIWCRKFPFFDQGYGYVEDNIPEMGIAVYPEYRGRGLGQLLMNHLFSRLRHNGDIAISLSVHTNNPAKKAYIRNNFVPVRRDGNNIVMVKKL